MIRTVLFAGTFFTFASCQMVDQPQVTTRETRIAQGLTVITDCAQTECGRLNLDSRLVEDYAIITPLTHVTAFMASYSDFSDLGTISAMTQLRELHIGATQVSDLSGLAGFENLTLLHAQNLGNVNDFSPIGRLSKLTELALGGNEVGDLAFVSGLRNLTALNLDGAEIDSFAGLRRHPSLETLDLVDASLPDDISVLKTIPNLKELSVSDWDLTDEHRVIIENLEARGVTVLILVPSVIVC